MSVSTLVLEKVRRPGRSRANVLYLPVFVAVAFGLLIAWLPLLPAAVAVLAPFVLILIYIEPLVGVALMLIAAPWGALESVALGAGLLDSGQFLFLVTVTIWLLRSAIAHRIVLRMTGFFFPLIVFIGVAAFTLLDAASLRSGLAELIKWLEIGAVALLGIDLSRTIDQRPAGHISGFVSGVGSWRILVGLILLAGTSQALIGIWQFGLRGSGPEHFQIAGGSFFRAYGTFEQPNPFGGFISWIAALSIGTAGGEVMHWLAVKKIDRNHLIWLALLIAACAASSLGLLFSWSRGAWLGFVVGIGFLLFYWPRRRAWGAVLLCAGLALLLFSLQFDLLPAAFEQRVASFTNDMRLGDVRGADINDANYSVLERLAHWQAAVAMAQYNLWSGVGFGNYEAAYSDYALINWPFALGHAHNYYLNILAETGVPGFLAYVLFWVVVIWQTLTVIRNSDWPQRGVALGLLASWIALSVHHLLDNLYVNNLYLYLGAMLGALQVLYERTCRKV